MPTRSSTSSMVTWSRPLSLPASPATTRNLPPGPAAHNMPLLLVEGTVWPGMGPPGRGPLRPPPRPACSLQKFCANREVPFQTQNGGMERWRLSAEDGKASVPLPKGTRRACPKTSPSCSTAHTALPWLPAFRIAMDVYRNPARVCLPALYPQLHLLPTLNFQEDTSNRGHIHRSDRQLRLMPVEP